MSTNIEWQRPKTTRMYLHPPVSERMYTLWREGKIIFGEEDLVLNEKYFDLVSAGIWFYDANSGAQLDFRKCEYSLYPDGIPIHSEHHRLGELDMTVECCSEFGRTPALYVKINVANNNDVPASHALGFLLRTAKEHELVFEAPDVYGSYNPEMSTWQALPSTWKYDGGCFTDGTRRLAVLSSHVFSFDQKTGAAKLDMHLSPKESTEIILAFDIGKTPSRSYSEVKRDAIAAWEKELSRIDEQKLPKKLLASPDGMRAIKNLTVQLLQCFSQPKGKSYALSRQGGLQRQVWTFESLSVLTALTRLGSFDDYVAPIIDLYFTEFLAENGEMITFGIPWARNTATVLISFAEYALARGDAEYFNKYSDRAYRSFEWIRRTRQQTVETDKVIGGLFPPMQSCDDDHVFQAWSYTDAFNLMGLKRIYEAFDHFSDPRAAAILAEYESYRAVMLAEWESYKASTSAPLKVPHSPRTPDAVIEKDFVFREGVSYLTEALDLSEDDVEKLIRTYTTTGMFRSGLYDRMPDIKRTRGSTIHNLDENGKCIVWYVCCHEYYWFLYFMRHGMTDRAREILEANFRYAMSDEYYMLERYNQRDPYFTPWMPNASANGRTVNMILDLAEI